MAMVRKSLSHYRIRGKLGEGGMGAVYAAIDTRLDREVALKVLPPELAAAPDRLVRFEQEAKTIAALSHPNIVTIYSVEETDGVHFLTLELVRGRTLAELVGGDGLGLGRLLDLAIPLAEALWAAHERGIIHRDLKPSNVMVTDDGVVKVLDFGLATKRPPRAVGDDEDTATEVAPAEGTLPYMSPEQIEARELQPQSDLFSFGVMLYEMATGSRPFVGGSPVALAASILKDRPPALGHGDCSSLQAVVERCLEKEPRDRFATARELVAALTDIREGLSGSSVAPLGAPSGAGERPSIAVLAFTDLSPGRDQEYFCDGLAEELINALTKIRDLRVVARTSSFAFKGEAQDPREIGARLRVRTILQGSVRRAGDRLRVTAQLIAASDGAHLWSERFDRDLDDIFAIQDEITSAIVDKLKIELLGEERSHLRRRHTEDLEAYHLYLKGRHFWNKRSPADLHQSIREFERALERDAGYALAHAGIADSYTILGFYSALRPDRAFPRAKAAATAALAIDDSLAEAHSSLAFTRLLYEWDWGAARRGFSRTFELNPGYATAHHWYAEYLVFMGHEEAAVAEAKRALELDPLSLIINTLVGWVYYYTRQFEQAAAALRATLELDPAFAPASFWLGLADHQLGRLEEGVQALERAVVGSDRSTMMVAALGSVLASLGRADEANRILSELRRTAERAYVPPYYIAAIHSGFGDADRTFEWLEKARAARDNWLVFLRVDPLWDGMRADPRFVELLAAVGFGGS